MGLRGLLASRKKKPVIPEGMRIYAIGDVHGRVDLLEQVFTKIDNHLTTNPVVRPVQVLLGDYIDRGPHSADVIGRLIVRAARQELVCLKGNHETFVLDFIRNPSSLRDWGLLGGRETLVSYGVFPPIIADAATQRELAAAFQTALPNSHKVFLANLRNYYACGNYFFVHAGVRPRIELNEQKEEDLLWIRDEFLLYEENFGKIIVHGHTPVREVDFRSNRINIDTGAYATGRLSCIMIESDRIEVL